MAGQNNVIFIGNIKSFHDYLSQVYLVFNKINSLRFSNPVSLLITERENNYMYKKSKSSEAASLKNFVLSMFYI